MSTEQWRKEHPEKARQYQASYKKRHPERIVEQSRKDALRDVGWTWELYQEIFSQQKGLCGICGRSVTGSLSADHDHLMCKRRGLLCQPCNLAIGLLQDNPEVVDAAAAYLRKYK
jgi:hypothetical protein